MIGNSLKVNSLLLFLTGPVRFLDIIAHAAGVSEPQFLLSGIRLKPSFPAETNKVSFHTHIFMAVCVMSDD